MKIRMIANKVGYPKRGETLDVSDSRAERWVLEMGIAEFVEKKDRVATLKKIEQRDKEIAEADKKLGKKLDALERGDPVDSVED